MSHEFKIIIQNALIDNDYNDVSRSSQNPTKKKSHRGSEDLFVLICLNWSITIYGHFILTQLGLLPNGLRYPPVGGTGQHYFIGTNSKPPKVLENAQTPTTMAPAVFAGDRVHALLGNLYERKTLTRNQTPQLK